MKKKERERILSLATQAFDNVVFLREDPEHPECHWWALVALREIECSMMPEKGPRKFTVLERAMRVLGDAGHLCEYEEYDGSVVSSDNLGAGR